MIELYAETLINNNLLELLSERGRNRVVKESLRHGLQFWHDKILPKHFEIGNIRMYPNDFTAKKKGGIPLVDTGAFRDRVLSNPTIRATFRSASIRYQFGRPSGLDNRLGGFYQEFNKDIRAMDSKTRNRIFSFMKGKSIKFEEARKQLISKQYKSVGYTANVKKRMARGVSAMNQDDRKAIYRVMENFVTDNWKTLGKANVKVSK